MAPRSATIILSGVKVVALSLLVFDGHTQGARLG
jgi:hypothetical protein